MRVVLGIVVHRGRLAAFQEAARTVAGVTLKWVTYDHEYDLRGQVERFLADNEVDGMLLGQLPLDRCRDLLPDVPVAVTRSATVDLSLALGEVLSRARRPVPVSVDTFEVDAVDEVTTALRIEPELVGCLPYAPQQTVAEVVAFHLAFHARHPGYVVSARTAVAARLGGVLPVVNRAPLPSSLRAELHQLAVRVRSRRATASRFAAGVFVVTHRSGGCDLDTARSRLLSLLSNMPEFADAWIENRGRRSVLVFAPQALFAHITDNWMSVGVLGRAEDLLGVRIAAGFGVGASARAAVLLAERAAARAELTQQPCGYLLEDSGVAIGPIGWHPQPLEASAHGVRLGTLARDVGLSPSTLSRLVALERTLAGDTISPSDLAGSLGITDPSGRRLIRKLQTRGLVTVEGSTQTRRKGRPSRLYRLAVDAAIARVA